MSCAHFCNVSGKCEVAKLLSDTTQLPVDEMSRCLLDISDQNEDTCEEFVEV